MNGELLNYALAFFCGIAVGTIATALYYRRVLQGALQWAQEQYLRAIIECDFYKSQLEESNDK